MVTTMNQRKIRTYSELITFPTLIERFDYLKLGGLVGKETFGWDRHLNQRFYQSRDWRRIRDVVIVRDNGCDLGLEGYGIRGKIYIHHMNPIEAADIVDASEFLLNPEFLICVSALTHDAIHYGDETLLPKDPIIRTANDTKLW